MDFGLSDDQQLLQQSVTRYLADHVGIERVRELRDRGVRNDRDVYQGLAKLGMTGILVPETEGGTESSLLDAALVAQALGKSVAPAAYLASAVMAPVGLSASKMAGTSTWLRGIAQGEVVMGVAATEAFSIREGAGVTVESGRLDGKAMMAIDADDADLVLVACGPGTLAVVRSDAPGVTIAPLTTVDATRSTAEIVLEGVEAEAIATDASAAIARMLDAGRITLAADTLGACESMIEQAVVYAGTRKQFDRVIGSFMAVKHLCAEMIADLEPARSLVWYAAHAFDAQPEEASLMACHAQAHLAEIGRDIASVATQVHGGIGWTDEQNLHFWFKRIASARHLLGGPELLRERAAMLQGLVA